MDPDPVCSGPALTVKRIEFFRIYIKIFQTNVYGSCLCGFYNLETEVKRKIKKYKTDTVGSIVRQTDRTNTNNVWNFTNVRAVCYKICIHTEEFKEVWSDLARICAVKSADLREDIFLETYIYVWCNLCLHV